MIISWLYRCRRCDAVLSFPATPTCSPDDALFRQVTTHSCNNHHRGVADLIGFNEEAHLEATHGNRQE